MLHPLSPLLVEMDLYPLTLLVNALVQTPLLFGKALNDTTIFFLK